MSNRDLFKARFASFVNQARGRDVVVMLSSGQTIEGRMNILDGARFSVGGMILDSDFVVAFGYDG